MSYILEALKKSEQERQLGHVPDISVTQATQVRPAPWWPRWLAAALLLNVLVLALIVWRPWVAPPPPETQPAVAIPKPAVPEARPAPEQVDPPRIEATHRDAPAAELPAAVTAMPIEAPEAAAPLPEVQEDSLSPHDAPRWEDLSAEVRAGLPAPRIDVHVFAREPARRFVLINLRKHREGDAVEGGARIDAILNDGVVLSYQGQRYRVGRP